MFYGYADKVVFAIPHSAGYRRDRKLVAYQAVEGAMTGSETGNSPRLLKKFLDNSACCLKN